MNEEKIMNQVSNHAKTRADFFKHNLTAIMKEKKINRVELAKKLDMPYTTLCDWCTGRIYPKREKIELIANALDVNVKDLDGIRWLPDMDDDVSNELARVTITSKIPYDMTPREACKKFPWFESIIQPKLLKYGSYYFGLKVSDNSMEPKMFKDDYAVFEQTDIVDRDGLYCVKVDTEDATIRYLILLKGGFAVLTLNTPAGVKTETFKFEDIGSKIQVLGRCRQTVVSSPIDDENDDK